MRCTEGLPALATLKVLFYQRKHLLRRTSWLEDGSYLSTLLWTTSLDLPMPPRKMYFTGRLRFPASKQDNAHAPLRSLVSSIVKSYLDHAVGITSDDTHAIFDVTEHFCRRR